MVRLQRFLTVLRAPLAGYVCSVASVGLVTVLIAVVLDRLHLANISMLYLLAVLATAVAFGRGPAVLASIAAFVTFNFLFVDPRHTLTVADPAEWVALILFLVTAIITGQLTAEQRRRAQQARTREREAVLLYEVLRLLTSSDLAVALKGVVELLHKELQLAGVVIEVEPAAGEPGFRVTAGDASLGEGTGAGSGPVHVLGQTLLGERTARWVRLVPPRQPGRFRLPSSDRLHVVPIVVSDRRVATTLLVAPRSRPQFREPDDRLLAAVANQLGQALERERLGREATEAEVLGKANELKTALMNAVSHDLRTPLASIIASAGSLRQQGIPWNEGNRVDVASNIEQEAERLNRLIGNLLDLSRIEGGSLQPEKGWYDIGALIDDVVGRLQPVLARHEVHVQVPDEVGPIELDYVEIDQVLSNLLQNAARYAAAGTAIAVSVELGDGEIEVAVADRGPGIPDQHLDEVFAPFFRVNRRVPGLGTGLGLAVARGLVEAHGGRIWAANRPGGGAEVTFTLPRGFAGASGEVREALDPPLALPEGMPLGA